MLHGEKGAGSVATWQEPEAQRKRGWLPYLLVAGVALAILGFFLANALTGGGGSGSSGSGQAQQEQSAATLYYLSVSDGKVAIFSNSSDDPYEVTDVAVEDLSSDSAVKLGAHVPASSLEEAQALVEQYRTEAADNKAAAEQARKEAEEQAEKAQKEAEEKARQEAEAKAQAEAQAKAEAEEKARLEAEQQRSTPVFTYASASSFLNTDEWKYYYGAENVLDDDFTTAWVEGVDSGGNLEGVGEWISINADSEQWVQGVSIVNGYGKSERVFNGNNRCGQVTIRLSDGFELVTHLDDAYRSWQSIDFGGYHKTTYIRIIIDSVVYGSEWPDDTAITEIRAY